jgi:hypothetical protein
MLGQ